MKTSRKKSPAHEPWYVRAFGKDYLSRYAHRSDEAARKEARFILPQLNLPPGARILDLCCGAGRHSRALAAAGYNVIGIDLSQDLLREARNAERGNSRARGTIKYVRADMRSIPLPSGSFDGAINMFTSFGYFPNDRDNAKVLREVARVLKPGAPFFMDYLNLATTIRSLVPVSVRNTGDVTIREERRFDKRTRMLIKTVEARSDKNSEVLCESLRGYSPAELRRMFSQAGFKLENCFGDLQGAKFDLRTSPRFVVLARKKVDRAK